MVNTKNDFFIKITDQEFKQLSNLVYTKFGITLPANKKSLVSGRLNKTLKTLGLKSFNDYYSYITSDKTGTALSELINRLSTNYTYFNREEKHFNFFVQKALPDIKKSLILKNDLDLRIWSAGCSTGEEAYTIAIYLKEFFGENYNIWDGGVLATDISSNVLDIAKKGIYKQSQLRKLSNNLVQKYFIKSNGDEYVISDKIKKEVLFKRTNLISDNFPYRKSFQIIFCRNVMIYFDTDIRNKLIEKFYKYLIPGGYLFIGHSETISREQNMFRYIQPAIYQRI